MVATVRFDLKSGEEERKSALTCPPTGVTRTTGGTGTGTGAASNGGGNSVSSNGKGGTPSEVVVALQLELAALRGELMGSTGSTTGSDDASGKRIRERLKVLQQELHRTASTPAAAVELDRGAAATGNAVTANNGGNEEHFWQFEADIPKLVRGETVHWRLRNMNLALDL